jgi:Rieske Fe-S protein
MQRRQFIKICSSAAVGCAGFDLASVSLPAGAEDLPEIPQPRVLLTDADGKPLQASTLDKGEAYVFSYPYASTPCFLIRLGAAAAATTLQADGKGYDWPGGVGPERSLVAYSAICAHQLSYPQHDSSVIAYDAGVSPVAGKPGMIVCCAHQSAYDAAAGAAVVAGPAPNPLAAIVLEHDAAHDTLTATGVVGSNVFLHFFKLYRLSLMREYGAAKFQQPAPASTPAIPLSKYSAYVANC